MNWKKLLRKTRCSSILKEVQALRKHQKIWPRQQYILRAFRLSPFNKTRVIIIGQDPYPGANQANGLAFAVNPGCSIPPSLHNILKEVEKDCGKAPDRSLMGWATQGVLLLNTTLTVQQGKTNSHLGLGWKQVVGTVIREFSLHRKHCVFMLWGKEAQKFKPLIEYRFNHLILRASHPSPLSCAGFFGCRHFSRANEYLAKYKLGVINWSMSMSKSSKKVKISKKSKRSNKSKPVKTTLRKKKHVAKDEEE